MSVSGQQVKPERSYSLALSSALVVRRRFIELTHELPEGAEPKVVRLWNEADTALIVFIRALNAAKR